MALFFCFPRVTKIFPWKICSINVSKILILKSKVSKCGRRIKEGSTVPVSICTTVGHIQTSPATHLQQNEKLIPRVWLGNLSSDEMKQRLEDVERASKNEFRLYRGSYLEDILKQVSSSGTFSVLVQFYLFR